MIIYVWMYNYILLDLLRFRNLLIRWKKIFIISDTLSSTYMCRSLLHVHCFFINNSLRKPKREERKGKKSFLQGEISSRNHQLTNVAQFFGTLVRIYIYIKREKSIRGPFSSGSTVFSHLARSSWRITAV